MDSSMQENQETRAALPPPEPARALKVVDRVVEIAQSLIASRTVLITSVVGLLFMTGCLEFAPPKPTNLPAPTAITRSVETPPSLRPLATVELPARQVEKTPTPTPTRTPAAAPAGGEKITKPPNVKVETWEQLTTEERVIVAKAAEKALTAANLQKEQAARDERAQENTRATAVAAAKAAEEQFNKDINQGKTTIDSPTDIPGAVWKFGGDISGTLWTLAQFILVGLVALTVPIVVLFKLKNAIGSGFGWVFRKVFRRGGGSGNNDDRSKPEW